MTIYDTLKIHLEKYPLMEPTDAVKLLYQSEFAGGHMIKDEFTCLKWIENEGSSLTAEQLTQPYFEDIGGGYCRLNLSIMSKLPAEVIAKIFIQSSNNNKGTVENFEKGLDVLRCLCKEGKCNFTEDKLEAYLDNYKKAGYPAVSHSETYRNNYHPAYRVVEKQYCDFIEVIISICRLMGRKEEVTVAIDGMAGAGKSNLAKLLSDIFDCNVFHCDDYFLTPELRTEERLKEVGGNMDYVRFRSEICDNLNSGREFTYTKFDCSTQEMGERINVIPKRINIIEGSYSMHPTLMKYYELYIFLGIEPQLQIERILRRNGEFLYKRFVNEWIPKENAYHEAMDIKAKCDLVYYIDEKGVHLQ